MLLPGKAFTPMKAASPAEFVSAITGVSCVSAKTCTAVGTTWFLCQADGCPRASRQDDQELVSQVN